MFAIMKKELKSYFLSPIGYVVIGIFLLVFSIFFKQSVLDYATADLGWLYYNTSTWGLMIITPILTMRMFSEERKTGTEQLLLTSPTGISGIIFGKLFAAMSVIGITLVISLMYFGIISYFAEPNILQTVSSILGFGLISMATISFGMFTSSLTENQIISGVLTIAFLMLSIFLANESVVLARFDLRTFYISFAKGNLSLENTISLLLFSFMFISFTAIVMQRRKLVK